MNFLRNTNAKKLFAKKLQTENEVNQSQMMGKSERSMMSYEEEPKGYIRGVSYLGIPIKMFRC